MQTALKETLHTPLGAKASPLLKMLSGSGRMPAYQWGGILLVAVAFAWSYWPTFGWMMQQWESQPDYAHGYFVLPIAIWFLWVRRKGYPHAGARVEVWGGLGLLGAAVLLRWFGDRVYLDSADGWSMMVWIAGTLTLVSGWRVLWWALPSILFLWFMIPMPFSLETALRQPLQDLATRLSCVALQILGLPAIAEANIIRIGASQFGVEEACSGLRIFVGIGALAYGYLVVVRRSWWIKSLLVASLVPIALFTNCTRIVATCILHEKFSSELAHRFSHDVAGLATIPFAFVLFGLLLYFLGIVIREEPVQSVGEVVRGSQAA
jgi:exosortase